MRGRRAWESSLGYRPSAFGELAFIEPTDDLQQTAHMDTSTRITTSVQQCGGRPCIRGMRIRVTDVLDLLAAGLSQEEILDELPDLEAEDIRACLQFACRRIDHPALVE